MLREKIACICCGNRDICYGQNPIEKGIVQGDVCSINLRKADQIYKEYMAWFKQEIEKLGVIERSELFPIVGKRTDKLEILIAEAQLQSCKDTLLRMME